MLNAKCLWYFLTENNTQSITQGCGYKEKFSTNAIKIQDAFLSIMISMLKSNHFQ
jgi:hypothetical protein